VLDSTGLIIFANDFIQDTLSTSFGLAIIPPFAPSNGKPAAAHFHVIVLASLKISWCYCVSESYSTFSMPSRCVINNQNSFHTSIRVINLQDFFRPPFINYVFLLLIKCQLLSSFVQLHYKYILEYDNYAEMLSLCNFAKPFHVFVLAILTFKIA
jgi:hypothetical protein